MHNHLFTYILLLIIILCLPSEAKADNSPLVTNETLLSRLDSIIMGHENLVKEKEIRINGLRNTLAKTSNPNERLGLARQLYDEYLVFDSDSASLYASKARHLTERLYPNDDDRIAQWKLNEAFIYTVQGLHDTAMRLLDTIDSSKLSPEMKSSYFGALAYLHSMRAVYVQQNHDMWKTDITKANAYRDSIQDLNLPPAEEWLWVPVATALDEECEDIRSVDITLLKNIVDNTTVPSRQNAINTYWVSRYYEALGDEDNMLRYKTMAAIYDALIVNREIAALQEIASYLFEKGELNRAYNYLIYTVNQANLYHNRYRMVSLSDVLPTVRDAYRIELEKRDSRMRILVWILALVSVVLLGSVIFIIIEYRRLKKVRNLLKTANEELSQSINERDKAIASLETANSNLNEANKQKLGLIAYAFKLTAQYINAMEDYRKKLLKKYKGKKIEDLGLLINDPELVKEQYQGFYEGFDKTVLSIFPDFIEEYNNTAGADNRVAPESIAKTGTLNTKLRIYALRRLGVSKSADIAQMLNLSIRTVYNNNKTTSSSSDEEQPAE
ncbi:MAG: hypothetical protein K2K95_03005 [Muribaculaceae bacterium]|nr:hypothetical protein [Muribaculaceae bacterium]